MTIKVQPNLINEIKEYGAFDVSACFNCGTCTATCPLSESTNEFPRGMIRLAQLGQKEKLVASKELWICHYCGDCSNACPRGANPAQFMHAARKYAIATNDITPLSKLFAKSKLLTILVMVFLGVGLALMMDMSNNNRWFEHDYSLLGGYFSEIIHYSGMTMGIFVALIFVIGGFKAYRSMALNEPLREREYIMDKISTTSAIKLAIQSFISMLINDGIKQNKFHRDDPFEYINLEEGNLPEYAKSLNPMHPTQKVSRKLIHMSIVYGFVGLFLATAYDYMIKDVILGNPGGFVEIYHPIRLLGVISGISMMFGTSMSMYYRLRKPEDAEYYKNTKFEDWLILILIWLVGLTGFILTVLVAVYGNPETYPAFAGWALIAHVVAVGELFVLLPFSKFAHILYRPLALWMNQYEKDKIEFLEDLSEEERQKIIITA
ncbi:MAG: 4Fe-4S dicluster domain-containing protein [Candidatus Heimdallarchaeota archaeon]|nr:4Fe-4S dicluster domain-containing protein [Candidatus Heimdallarchaeota archaeon]